MTAEPIIVIGAPRSGTTLTMRMLEAGGCDIGRNLSSFVPALCEFCAFRDGVVKTMLRGGGYDPLGQHPLPPKQWLPSAYWISRYRNAVEPIAARAGDKPWAFKAIKGAYAPSILFEAFPRATYVWVGRPENEHIDSLIRTPFMRVGGQDREAWRRYISWHRQVVLEELAKLTNDIKLCEPWRHRKDPGYWQAWLEMLGLYPISQDTIDLIIETGKYKEAQ